MRHLRDRADGGLVARQAREDPHPVGDPEAVHADGDGAPRPEARHRMRERREGAVARGRGDHPFEALETALLRVAINPPNALIFGVNMLVNTELG